MTLHIQSENPVFGKLDSPYTSDTSPEAEAIQLEAVRRLKPSERLEIAMRLTSALVSQSKSAIRRRFPEITADEVEIKFIELHYGQDLADAVRAQKIRSMP